MGFHHAFTPNSRLIGNVRIENTDFDTRFSGGGFKTEEDGYIVEVQHLYRPEKLQLITGVGSLDVSGKTVNRFLSQERKIDVDNTNLYLYSQINYFKDYSGPRKL